MNKKFFIAAIAVIAILVSVNFSFTRNGYNNLDLDAIRNVAMADAENPGPDVWYRFGEYTLITNSGSSSSLSVSNGGTTITGTYNSGDSYTTYDCIGWFGDC
ncbi:hypothetical protein K4L44_06865 [Halosquirtibacter laminarini]|uniref:Uncharacterized protein n=1 Tax=Halosquirtibacter laminarini TaxID=3374600 RepID=A0AC61NJ33_9BACT|nr:hypothetical protein K4L44_06865 [Prolixibacteraceae bacterium]